MRARAKALLSRLYRRLSWPTVAEANRQLLETNQALTVRLAELAKEEPLYEAKRRYLDMVGELAEAVRMAGAGPWRVSPSAIRESARIIAVAESRLNSEVLRETDAPVAAGAFGDIELALQNVEWKREVQLGWLEFSRWGIQQIILISRLYWVKNPIIRRLINVCAAYVFARGVEISTGDDTANQVIRDFLEHNKRVLGHAALVDLERRKDYDGNLFFAVFADQVDKGTTTVRLIDALEIDEIVCNPEDADEPWFYKRLYTVEAFDMDSGRGAPVQKTVWYPALDYEPDDRRNTIGGDTVDWATRVYHRKCGTVGKWKFGCPRAYPALDWAKESRSYLESCASVRRSLSQIAMTFTSKGGQQALEAAKQQLQTSVGPSAAIWDQNPPAVAGSVFGSGPGTKLEAFKTQGAGFDPEGVRQYKLMCAMAFDVPETFLADVSTGNLATATTLDRPTETCMLEKQESWVEDLAVLAGAALRNSAVAQNGRLREAYQGAKLTIRECNWKIEPTTGRRKYSEAKTGAAGEIKIQVNFPAIREGDIPAMVGAIVAAATYGNKGGQVVGIDEKEAVTLLYEQLGVENGGELAEQQYPESEYDPDRTTEPLPAPIPKALPDPGGAPQAPGGRDPREARVRDGLGRLHTAITAVLEAGN